MNYLFIIIPAIIMSIVLLYIGLKGAFPLQEEEDPFIMQEEPKFEPRKVTDLSKGEIGIDGYKQEKPPVAPRKKYYKKKKKKAPVEKKPVGRPRKNTE
jgi:hypothetical protein